jgi:uroporphyrinogen decarboxylase
MDKKPVDYVPVGFWKHFFDKGVVGQPCIDAHIEYYKQADLDFLKVMSDGYFAFPTADGKQLRSAADLRSIRPVEADDPWIRAQVERVQALVEAFGKERCVFYNVFTPFTTLKCCFEGDSLDASDAVFMKAVREDTDAVLGALDIVAQGNALLAECIIKESGADGIYFPVSNAEHDRFTEQEYRRIIGPSELYVLEHINRWSDYNILHCCGFAGTRNRISLWYDYPAKCVNWAVHVDDLSLSDGRVLFGGKSVLGGFDTHWGDDENEMRGILYHGSKEELQSYTKELILNAGKLGLLLGGDCTTDHRIDPQRLNWIIEAARS